MAINKNFIVRNGIEVDTDLIFADSDIDRVGIATTNPSSTLDVNGTTTSNNVVVQNELTLNGTLRAGGEVGANNQYLISTGVGVTWTTLPGLRDTYTITAGEGQLDFSAAYNAEVGVDVFVNGVRLSPQEYTATDGSTITLVDAAFEGDTVDIVAYSVAALAINNDNINVTGIVSSSGGFLSSGNDPVTIRVEGTELIFEVVGIGSTSFTLS